MGKKPPLGCSGQMEVMRKLLHMAKVSKLESVGQFCPVVNKILLDSSYTYTFVYSCFSTIRIEFPSCDRASVAHKILKYSLSSPLRKSLPNPGISNHYVALERKTRNTLPLRNPQRSFSAAVIPCLLFWRGVTW